MLPGVGEFFQAIRKAKGLSQEEIAKGAEVDRTSLSKFESSVPAISVDKIKKIADTLQINPDLISNPAVNAFPPGSFLRLTASRFLSIPGGIHYSELIMYLVLHTGRLTVALLLDKDEVSHVAARDEQDTVFVIRRKGGFGKINEASQFVARSDEIARMQKETHTEIKVWHISDKLRQRLKVWEVLQKEDLLDVFEFDTVLLNQHEKAVVDAIRQKQPIDQVGRLIADIYHNKK